MIISIIYLASVRKKHCILMWYENKKNTESKGQKRGKTL